MYGVIDMSRENKGVASLREPIWNRQNDYADNI